ncbi:MAG: ammonium transporter [Gammaproteobacteria bacterium]|nr:ammonium transporter [Gammaproteobacteria bacterium]
MLLCAFLVFIMQAGFLCLETGLVRAKNSINVAVKNLIDFCLSGTIFWLFGYALMFGQTQNGWFGSSGFLFSGSHSAWLMTFFIFQAMFCSTAATIVSGAVAERMHFFAYCLTTLMMSAMIYPVTGHWAWGGVAQDEPQGWLARLGFIDFAGSTVVHSVGGWVSLAAVLLLGPRYGRFDQASKFPIQGSNLPMAALGVFLLWFGWFGFNGGSTLALNDRVPLILLNTFLAGACGGVAAMAYSFVHRGYLAVADLLNGIVGGLVGITASCHIQLPALAVLIGGVAGLIVVAGSWWLERWRVDDAVGVIPAHLFAGIWGTLAVALFAPPDSLTLANRGQQLLVQMLGVLAIGGYAFTVSFISLWLIDRVYRLRVNVEVERVGLNIAEHAASTEIIDLLTEMESQRQHGDFSQTVIAEPHTEVGQIAQQYNHVLQRVNEEIHRREDLLQALTVSETRKSAILDAVLDCIVTINRRGLILEFNPAAARTFGCSQRGALGRDLAQLMILEAQRPEFEQALQTGFIGDSCFVINRRVQTTLQRIDGESFPAELGITRVRDGHHLEYNLHIRDVTRQRHIQRRLYHLAHYDQLTGLANRNYLRQGLTYYLMADAPRQAAVLFLDLDRFKNINDTLGHAAGDQLLREVADRLRQYTRSDDLLARWGGDEFVIALLGTDKVRDLTQKARLYIEVLAQPYFLEGKTLHAPTSIGVAVYPDGGDSAEALIRNADLALYQAKGAGRNNYQFFTPELAHRVSERFDCENELREALGRNEFELYYQPQVAIATGALIGAEALLRWRHPEKGLVQPGLFIPILEESGLIEQVGAWVIEAACRQSRVWRSQGLQPLRIAVNVSGRQFLQTDFANTVTRILHEGQLEPSGLELEITETVLARDSQQCVETLQTLKDLGLEIAVDDFGTGYSSLSYLKRFPIDTIKIDRSFVSECDVNGEDSAICAAILSLARSLGLKTLAEGVDQPGQLNFLRAEGCFAYQGYLFSKPLPAGEMAEMLRKEQEIWKT